MIPVEFSVKLEVLDWGGTGRPLVLLTGMGDTAHVFDKFAPKLTAEYHAYGVTRRGCGVFSKPEFLTANYNAARLRDDLLAVITALHLSHPILAGHSLAGEELSDIGFHHPEAVAGLIYSGAGYSYPLYDQAHGQIMLDALKLRDLLPQIVPGKIPSDVPKSLNEIQEQLKLVEKEIVEYQSLLPPLTVAPAPRPDPPPYFYAISPGRRVSQPSMIRHSRSSRYLTISVRRTTRHRVPRWRHGICGLPNTRRKPSRHRMPSVKLSILLEQSSVEGVLILHRTIFSIFASPCCGFTRTFHVSGTSTLGTCIKRERTSESQ